MTRPHAGPVAGRCRFHGARTRVIAVAVLVGCMGPGAAVAGAQVTSAARLAEGQVSRATDDGPVPVRGQMVVLHRVGSDRAAPLDSVRTGAGGRFRFRYQATGSPDALYFVSAMYDGIAYFSPPLRSATVSGGDADIIVYDTTADTTELRLQARHVVVAQPRGTRRDMAEVFEIENHGSQTVVARDSVTPLLTLIVPEQAESLAVAPGDIAAASVRFRPGRAEVYAPVSPGIRQLVITYRLPFDAFPMRTPVRRPLAVLEVLLEEPRAEVAGAGLAESAPAPIDGRMFRRFLAQDVAAPAVVTITAPAPAVRDTRALKVLLGVLLAAMLGTLVVWYSRRGRQGIPVRARARRVAVSAPPPRSEQLIAEMAALDASFEREGQADREQYRARRAELKARIASALAAESKSP